MSDTVYKEIEALNSFIRSFNVRFNRSDGNPAPFNLIYGSLIISERQIRVFIEDEYEDLLLPDPCIPVVLALREFELIEESTDYLNWCRMMGVAANSEVLRNYYQETVRELPELKMFFDSGELTSFISDLDFQLNAGAMQWLRSHDN